MSIEVQPGFCPLSSEDPSLFQRPCFVVLLLEKHNTAVRHHVGKAAHCIVSFCTVYPSWLLLLVAPHTHTHTKTTRATQEQEQSTCGQERHTDWPSILDHLQFERSRARQSTITTNTTNIITTPSTSPHFHARGCQKLEFEGIDTHTHISTH